MNSELKHFLEQFNRPETHAVMESIFEGYVAIFEGEGVKLYTGMTSTQYKTLKQNNFQPKEYLVLQPTQALAQRDADEYSKDGGKPIVFVMDKDKAGKALTRIDNIGTSYKGYGRFNELLKEPIKSNIQDNNSEVSLDDDISDDTKSNDSNMISKSLNAVSKLDTEKTGQKEAAKVAKGALDAGRGVMGVAKGIKNLVKS